MRYFCWNYFILPVLFEILPILNPAIQQPTPLAAMLNFTLLPCNCGEYQGINASWEGLCWLSPEVLDRKRCLGELVFLEVTYNSCCSREADEASALPFVHFQLTALCCSPKSLQKEKAWLDQPQPGN